MIKKIDHAVITTSRLVECLDFYKKMGFEIRQGDGRYELFAGDFKINVHVKGEELFPHAGYIQTGSADLCFEITGSLVELKAELAKNEIKVVMGIVERIGRKGAMQSIYVRDPDENLLEFCSYNEGIDE